MPEAMPSAPPPLIGVTACRKPAEHATAHSVGDKYVDAVLAGAQGVPVIIPAFGPALGPDLPIRPLLARLDGVLLTGSPSNIDPALYGKGPRPEGDIADPHRDATTLPLIRACLDEGVPLLAICRGFQEVNVALGGTLHGRLHEVDGRMDHRSDKSVPHGERYGPRHPVTLTQGGLLARLMDGAESITVNSLHGQGIDRLADGLAVEAVAPDGTIEAASVPGAQAFALALQWHAEWRVAQIDTHRRVFAAFGDACRLRLAARQATTDERLA